MTRLTKTRNDVRRIASQYATRAVHLLAVVTILLGGLRAGSVYFYCGAMEQVFTESCCEPTHRSPSDAPALERAPCCESHSLGVLPTVAQPRPAASIAAPLVGLVPLGTWTTDARTLAVTTTQIRVRSSGVPPPRPDRAHLMVFLI